MSGDDDTTWMEEGDLRRLVEDLRERLTTVETQFQGAKYTIGDLARRYEEALARVRSLEVDGRNLRDLMSRMRRSKDHDIDALSAQNARLRKALEPFVSWAKSNVRPDPDTVPPRSGVWVSGGGRDRILDWFGPSDFQNAVDAFDFDMPRAVREAQAKDGVIRCARVHMKTWHPDDDTHILDEALDELDRIQKEAD